MTSDHQASKLGEDYRQSHLARGSSYDAALAANPFDTYMAEFERDYLRQVVLTLFSGARPRYLDFACGTARITQTVAPLAGEAVGVDISPSMLEEARAKCPGVRFVHADLTKSEIDLGTFELITSFRFLGNAQDDLRVAVLRTLNRLLRPNGYLIINSHRNPHSLAARLNSLTGGERVMDLHYAKLQSLLREHGFEIVQTRPIGVWIYRSKLMGTADYRSARAQRLERMFRHPVFTAIAPDAVVVARKIRSL